MHSPASTLSSSMSSCSKDSEAPPLTPSLPASGNVDLSPADAPTAASSPDAAPSCTGYLSEWQLPSLAITTPKAGLPWSSDGPRKNNSDILSCVLKNIKKRDDVVDAGDARKRKMRAQQSQKSAIVSQEWRVKLIKELERRVSLLSAQDAQLDVGQLEIFRQRMAKERELAEETKDVKEEC